MDAVNPADHVGMVKDIVMRFSRTRNFERHIIDELVQEGSRGLTMAARKYDPARGTAFSSYAYWWIFAYIYRYINSRLDLIHVPIKRFREGTMVERPLSLDAPLFEALDGHREMSMHDTIAGEATSPEAAADAAERRRIVWAAVAELPERTQAVIRRRFVDDATLEEVGQELGVTKQGVQYIERHALKLLRERLQGRLGRAA